LRGVWNFSNYSLFYQSIKISRLQLGEGIALMRPQTTLREVPEGFSEPSVVVVVLVIVCYCGWKDDGELSEGMRPKCAKFQLRQGKNRWWSRIIASSLREAPSSPSRRSEQSAKSLSYFIRGERNSWHPYADSAEHRGKNKEYKTSSLLTGKRLADSSTAFVQEDATNARGMHAANGVKGIRVVWLARVTARLGRVTFGSNFVNLQRAVAARISICCFEMNEFTSTKLNCQNFERNYYCTER